MQKTNKPMNKLPAIQFYVGDWRKDPGVQALNYHDRGVWFEMICLMHESEQRGKLLLNGAAMPEDALARILGLDNQILTTTLTTLLTYGVATRCDDSGAIMSRRMIRDENLRKVRAECGKQGGNPNLVNQKPTTKVNQKPTPSSSSSFSISSTRVLSLDNTHSEKIYNLYPKKVGKDAALKAIKKALATVDANTLEQIVTEYAESQKGQDAQYIPNPSTWFNQGRWQDDKSTWKRENKQINYSKTTYADRHPTDPEANQSYEDFLK